MKKVLTGILLCALLLAHRQPAYAVAAPDSPTYSTSNLKVVVDNDYVAFYGDSTNAQRLMHQNNYPWNAQVANALSIDITPTVSETYVYLGVMGGGGNEDFGAYLNGQDIVFMPGAQVATGRSPVGTSGFTSPYATFQSYVSGYSSTNVANGTQNVTLAQIQTALTGATWGSAVGTLGTTTGTGYVPNYKTSGVCCDNAQGGGGGILSGKGWAFPSDSLVVFRYPVTSLGLPIQAGNTQVKVDWSAPTGGTAVEGYQVEYKKSSDPDSSYVVFSRTTAANTVETVTGLTNGVQYSFRVASTNSGGMSPYSVVKTATPFGSSVGAPSISASLSKGVSATLTVNQSFSGKVRFFVDGKKIPNCLNVTATGTSPNFTATCTFKPSWSGRVKLNAYITSTDGGYASTYSNSIYVQVGRRSNNR